MPDNSTNWTADEGFWDEAWTDMQQQLDEHLPLTPTRKRGLLWWFSGGLGILLLLGAGWFYQRPEVMNGFPLPTTLTVATDQSGEDPVSTPFLGEPSVVREREVVAAQTYATKKTPQVPTKPNNQVATSVNLPSVNATAQPKYRSKSRVAPTEPVATRPPSELNEAATSQSAIPTPESAASPNFTTVETAARAITGLPEAKPSGSQSTKMPSLGKIDPLAGQLLLPLEQTYGRLTEQLNGRILPGKRTGRTSFLLEATLSHGSRSPGIGYYLGLGVERRIGRKHALAMTLGFQAQRQQFVFKDVTVTEEEPITSTPSADSTVSVTADLNAYLTGDHRNFVSSYDLRLGIDYSYRLGRRWGINVSGGVSYLLSGFAPGIIDAIQAGEFNNFSPDRIALENSTTLGFSFNQLDEAVNVMGSEQRSTYQTNGIRLDWGLGASYQLSNRTQLIATYRNYTTSTFEASFIEANRHRLNLGLRYRW